MSEEYEEVAPRLDQLGLHPFKKDLVRLVDLAVAGADQTAVSAALADANAVIDDRIAAARGKAGDAGTYLAAITALLRKAAAEYGARRKQGRIVDAEEYQDARGFVLIVRDEVAKANPALRQKDARAAESLGETLDRLAGILAEPVPPARPSASSSEVYGRVARAEIAINRLK